MVCRVVSRRYQVTGVTAMNAADRWRVVVFSGCGHGVIAQTLASPPAVRGGRRG